MTDWTDLPNTMHTDQAATLDDELRPPSFWRSGLKTVNGLAQAASYFRGLVVIAMAVATLATGMNATTIAAWVWDTYGGVFLALYTALVLGCLFCWVKLREGRDPVLWGEAALQAADAIAILALTFTLIGVSFGVGTLAKQDLTPATVQGLIRGLTEYFSLAFLATVLGLPTATALRALIVVTRSRQGQSENTATEGH